MPRISRFKRRNSDRSGFKFYEIELVKEGVTSPLKVAGDEFDAPPPSKISLGGEGDVSSGELRANADFSVSGLLAVGTGAGFDNPTVYVTAAVAIAPNFTHPWMRVTGSNSAVTMTANPQVGAGQEKQVLTLQCVDSGVTLSHASGLNLIGSARFIMTSGSVITFYYSSGGSVWNETSRNY